MALRDNTFSNQNLYVNVWECCPIIADLPRRVGAKLDTLLVSTSKASGGSIFGQKSAAIAQCYQAQ